MKRLLKNNLGMTLMEILVALSLLMIIIVGTTPVMLQAYNGLYTAGEKTQETYEAKSEIENKLATRNTRNSYPGFVVNFNNLGEVATLSGRRAVSAIKGSLETLFSGVRVRVAVISSKNVNDDYDGDGWHEVVLQTTNLDFGTLDAEKAKAKVSMNNQGNVKEPSERGPNDKEYLIDITFLIPKKTNPDASIYSFNNGDDYRADLKLNAQNYPVFDLDPVTGRITVWINGFDFTQSPIKILVTYLDENNKKQTTEAYLYVDQPTIMAVGAVGTYDYYTSPGVVVKSVSEKDDDTDEITRTEVEEFGVYGRKMTLRTFTHDTLKISFNPGNLHGGTAYPKIDSGVYAIPAGTVFKSINWIDSDETTGLNPYYVITGTNGTIYRTYSLNGSNETVTKMLRGIKKNTSGGDTEQKKALDKTLTIEGKTIYPAMWGGDVTHQFGYSTYAKSMGYQSDGDYCWYTATFDEKYGKNGNSFENPEANSYSTRAKYAYYYNGYGTGYSYTTQNSRKISYILTEIGYSTRRGGYMSGKNDFGEFYNKIWEKYSDSTRAEDVSWYARSASGDMDAKFQIPIYFHGDNGNKFTKVEEGLAQIRIKYLTTNQPFFLASQKRSETGSDDTNRLKQTLYLNDDNSDVKEANYSSKVTVTDAVYIPETKVDGKKVGGEVFYVGTVDANALINQTDNLYPHAGRTKHESINTNDWKYAGYRTAYAVFGDSETGTTSVYKLMYTENFHPDSKAVDKGNVADSYKWFFHTDNSKLYWGGSDTAAAATAYNAKVKLSGSGYEANSDEAHEFYVYRVSPGATTSDIDSGMEEMLFNDVQFTMGFASDRSMTYSQIVFGKVGNTVKEAYKGCEPYYFKTHYADLTESHLPNLYMTPASTDYISKLKETTANKTDAEAKAKNEKYFNSYENDYYNVWFPGEMYNLTKVATKEGVTVSVGYAVAGSTYQFLNPKQDSNSSTALGGIYNDGVLSAMIGGTDSSLENLLYYKDNVSFDGTSLSNGKTSYDYTGYNGTEYDGSDKSAYGLIDDKGYGTHTRNSIQFTAVDIGVQYTEPEDNVEKATFYAYYADNTGRVFRSKVATRKTNMPSGYNPEDEEAKDDITRSTPVKVKYISDKLNTVTENSTTKEVFYTPSTVPSDDDTIGYMEQITLPNNKEFTDYFDSITKITIEGNMIFISGKPNQSSTSLSGIPVVVGMVNDETNVITWTVVYQKTDDSNYKNYWVEDMLVLNGYLYTVGRKGSGGFITAMYTGDLRAELVPTSTGTSAGTSVAASYTYYQILPETETKKLHVKTVDQPLYAIAGHS